MKQPGGNSRERVGTVRHVVSQACWVHSHGVLKCLKGFKINKSRSASVSAMPVSVTQCWSRK